MKSAEFRGKLTETHVIEVPSDMAREIPAGSDLRVIVFWGADDDTEWRRLTANRFSAAYAPEDSIYEQLP